MPPPNAASLGKYGDIPVSYYTGVPNVGIPIYTVTDGPVSLPVSLSYHAGGLKVGETASWCGIGWSLQAGGIISRTVQGREDERAGGYFNTGKSLSIDANGCLVNDTYNASNFQSGLADGEPDIFSFSVGGYSGKFFFEADKTDDEVTNPKIVLIPKQDLRIDYQLDGDFSNIVRLKTFTMTTPDGTRYQFGNIDSDANLKGIELTRTNPTSTNMTSSWYLRKVSSADGNYNITLDYASEKYRYGFRAGFGLGYQSTPSNAYRENVNYVEGWRLSSITSPTATVTFVAGPDREDIDNRDFGNNASASPAKSLQAIQVQSGTLCKSFELSQAYYADATGLKSGNDNTDKRLKLTGIQEKSCDNSVTVNPYSFQYYEDATTASYLPNRLSSGIDHWGFYNGAANTTSGLNIPATRLQFQNQFGESVDIVKGTSNRETNEAQMLLGTLKKISYPTGGATTFEYEANSYYGSRQTNSFIPSSGTIDQGWPTGQCTDGDRTLIESVVKTLAASDVYYYKWEILGAKAYSLACLAAGSLELRAVNNITGTLLGSATSAVNTNDNDSSNDVPTVKDGLLNDLIAGLPTGVPIRFEMYGKNAASRFTFSTYSSETTTGDIKVGGLRVKKITSNDGISSGNDVVKSYTYLNNAVNTDRSSAILYNDPIYGYAYKVCINPDACSYTTAGICNGTFQYYVYGFFFENSVVPLGSFEGYHIGYSSVKEFFNGSANNYYNLYQYINEPSPGFTGLPVEPAAPRISSGQLSSKAERNASSVDISYENYTAKGESPTAGQGTYLKFVSYFRGGEPTSPISLSKKYPIATRPFRYQKIESYRDGQLVTVDKEYNSTSHLQLTKQTVQNSDEKITETEYIYPADLAGLPAAQLTAFNSLNLLVPLETNIKVAGSQVKGSKTEYGFFDNTSGNFLSTTVSSGSDFIHPYQFKNYEAGWVQKGQIDGYHGTATTTGRAGLPKQFTKTAWLAETYEWTSAGLIKQRSFKDFKWQYEYLAGTGMVSKITNPDGQFSEYVYDPLMCLQQAKARGNNVVTTYAYTYPAVNGSGIITSLGNVKATTSYTAVAGSGLGTQETFQYFDGLGRGLETVYKGKATGGKDQIVAIGYDNQGRTSKNFEPFASSASDGSYQAPGSNPFTSTEYEENALNRVWKVTPPSWAASVNTYTSNTSGDAVLNYNFSTGGSSAFGDNLLSKTTTTDGNGNKSISFTDKKGRMILSRKANSDESTTADTYYVYDDKDRLVRVIPPGASWSSSELVFTYQYTDNDLISQKKVPGKAYEAYEYNSRDLPVKYQDPILRANASRWMGSKYDDYGRLTQKGVYDSGSGDGIVLSNNIIENIYGTATSGIETDKLKISKVQVFTTADPVVTPGAANGVLQTTFNYDTYGRIGSTTGNNHTNLGSLTAENISYSFDHGDNILTETRSSNHSAGSTTIANSRLFDSWGRLTQTKQNLNNAGDKIISEISYTDKDELAWKKIGNGLQQIDYSYLQNGLLSSINGSSELSGSTFPVSNMLTDFSTPTFTVTTDDLFRQVLEYNSLTGGLNGTSQNSGNIGQMIWQVKGRSAQAYGFTYDYLDRLTTSRYSNYTAAGAIDPVDYYGESLNFDARGNVISIARKGMVKGVDKYTNSNIDNQILTVPASGNLTTQSNGTSSIPASHINLDAPHNYLNLPNKFDFGSNNTIELLYDGLGSKLRKTVKTSGTVTLIQDYLDGIELKNNTVEAVYNEEGRAFNNAGTFRYEYALRDHLGNTRVVFTDKDNSGNVDNTEILNEIHYYPFGKTFDGAWYDDATASKYKYLYNGKELSEEFDLNFYDYGARWLDPGLGSWWEVDPASEGNRRWTPYAYGNNNPVRFIDPDGRESSAYGGFTSSAELQTMHAAASDAANKRIIYDDKGRAHEVDDRDIAGSVDLDQLSASGIITSTGSFTEGMTAISWESIRQGITSLASKTSLLSLLTMVHGDTRVNNKKEQGIVLYRGVHMGHPDYKNALKGRAVPRGINGGHSDPERHTGGATNSIFTSWSLTKAEALKHANGRGPGGIVLEKSFSITKEGVIPQTGGWFDDELEYLVPGVVNGAKVQIVK